MYKKELFKIEKFTFLGNGIVQTSMKILEGKPLDIYEDERAVSLSFSYLFEVDYNEEFSTELALYVDYCLNNKNLYLKLLADDNTELCYDYEFLDSYKEELYLFVKEQTDIDEKMELVKEVLKKEKKETNITFENKQTIYQNLLNIKCDIGEGNSLSYNFADGKFSFYWIFPKEGKEIFMACENVSEEEVFSKFEKYEEFKNYVNDCKKKLE